MHAIYITIQIPALLNLNASIYNKHNHRSLPLTRHIHHQSLSSIQNHYDPHHLHYISSHPFSWSSDANKRSTATKPLPNVLPNLKGTEEAEYPGEWDKEKGISKKKVPSKTDKDGNRDQTYLEDEYFGDRSPIQDIQGLIKPKLPDLDKKEALTPLAEEIKQMIHVT